MERSILKDDHRVMNAVSQLYDVRFISMDIIQLIDRELVSFVNINTPADLEQITKKGFTIMDKCMVIEKAFKRIANDYDLTIDTVMEAIEGSRYRLDFDRMVEEGRFLFQGAG